MRIGVYFCNCGGNIADRMDTAAVAAELQTRGGAAYVRTCDFLCADEGKEFLRSDLVAERPDRFVVAACSPREYEAAFRQVAERAGLNPYFLHMANIREHVAWVTPDAVEATRKAAALIRGGIARVRRHEPLVSSRIPVVADALVIGGGPAGLKSALTLAQAGRRVTLVEKGPALGGAPVLYEELFPALECGPCLLEPVQAEALHGEHAGRIEMLLLSEVAEVSGYFGNFAVKIHRRPRYVDETACIGCSECIAPCPVELPDPFNYGMSRRKAISFAFPGVLPNAPYIDRGACAGEECGKCSAACPVEGAIQLSGAAETLERQAGGIVVAVGAGLFDVRRIPRLGYGRVPGVATAAEFERMLASNGPAGGQLPAARSFAIVHCVGSLDDAFQPYCSGVCCSYAFKFNHLIRARFPEARVHHVYKEICVPGKEEHSLYEQARKDAATAFIRFAGIAEIDITECDGRARVSYGGGSIDADVVVLCPAVVPSADTARLAATLDVPTDRFGFFEELHGRADCAKARRKGVYLAGACQAPMSIAQAMTQAMAATGHVLSALREGEQLTIDPAVAVVDADRCSACRICGSVCPYRAISHPPERGRAEVNKVLCQGCGTCAAACPSGAIGANHFTNGQILAEVEAVLQ